MTTSILEKALFSQEPVNPNTGLTNSKKSVLEQVILQAPNRTTMEPIPLGQYGVGESKYNYDITQYNVKDLESIRGYRQPGIEQFGAFLNQAVVGEIIGGTIEGIGYLTGLEDAVNIISGDEVELGNVFTRAGQSIREWSKETTPIYKTYNEGEFAPSKWSWWMNNATSVASILSLMLPAMGTIKGLSMLGKATGLSAKLSPEVAGWAKVLGQAGVSRHIENLLEASGKYEEIYNRDLEIGKSIEEATRNASIGASDIYNKNWILVAQDILSYKILSSGFGKLSEEATPTLAKAAGLGVIKPTTKRGLAVMTDMLSEGAEEGYQYVVSEYADELAKKRIDPSYEVRGIDEIVKDGDFWTNVTFGALGSSVFQTIGRKINNKVLKIKGIESHEDRRARDIVSWGPTIKQYSTAIQNAEEIGNEELAVQLKHQFKDELKTRAASIGNFDLLKDWITKMSSDEITEEELSKFKMDTSDKENLKSLFPDLNNEFKEFEDTYNHYKSKTGGGYIPKVALELTRLDIGKRYLNERRNKLEEKLSTKESELINNHGINKFSSTGLKIFEKQSDIDALKAEKGLLWSFLKDKKNTSDKQREHYQKRLDTIDVAIPKLDEEKKVLRSSKEYTKAEKKIDSDIFKSLAGSDKLVSDYNKIKSELLNLERALIYKDILISEFQMIKEDNTPTTDLQPEPDKKELNQIVQEVANKIVNDELLTEVDIEFQKTYPTQVNMIVAKLKKVKKFNDELPTILQTKINEYLAKENESVIVSHPSKEGFLRLVGNKGEYFLEDLNTRVRVEDIKFDPNKTFNENDLVPLKIKEDYEAPLDPEIVDELEIFEPTEETNEEYSTTEDQFQNGTIELDYLHLKAKENESPKAADEQLDLWLSNPDNTLEGKSLEFTIGYDYKGYWEKNPDTLKKVKEGKFSDLTPKEIADMPIFGSISGIPGNLFIPTSALTTEAKKGLGIKRIRIPSWIKGLPEDERKVEEKKYLKSYSSNQENVRSTIIKELLKGNKVSTTEIQKTKGLINEGPVGAISTNLGIEARDVKILYGIPGGYIVEGKSGTRKQRGLHGGVGGGIYMAVTKTSTGEEQIIKLRPVKISVEHADIVYRAFKSAIIDEGGFKKPYDSTKNVEGLTNQQVLQYLVYQGEKSTKILPTDENRQHLKNKQLYINGKYIYYGINERINVEGATKNEVKAFKQWLIENKNYPVGKEHETILKKNFKLGNITYKKGEKLNFNQVLAKEGLILTNTVTRTETGNSISRAVNVVARIDTVNDLKVDGPVETKEKITPINKVKDPVITEVHREKLKATREKLHKRAKRPNRIWNGNTTYEVFDKEKELEWLKEHLNNVPVSVLNDFIRVLDNTGNKKSFAQVRNASIYLYNKAEVGTVYHEAFHVVSLYYLTEERRQAIYKNAREVYPELKGKDDTHVNEFLAERFREFVLTDKVEKPKSNLILAFFNKLLDFIKNLFVNRQTKLDRFTVEKLFNQIEKGKYRKAKIDKVSYHKNYDTAYNRLTDEFTMAQIKSITDLITYQLITTNNLLYELQKRHPKLDYNLVKVKLQEFADAYAEDYKEDNTNEEANRLANLYTRILTRFEEFKYYVNDRLLSMKVVQKEDIRFDPLTGEEITNYDKANVETNSRDNALTTVKLFFATLPDGDKIDPYTDSYQLVDFGSAWSRLLKDSWRSPTVNDLVDELKKKATTSQFYTDFLYGTDERPGFLTGTEAFRTQVFVTLNKYRNEFLNQVVNEYTIEKRYGDQVMEETIRSHKNYPAGVALAETDVAKRWSFAFANSTDFFDEKGLIVKNKIANIKTRFIKDIQNPIKNEYSSDKNLPNIKLYSTRILDFLGSIGVSINDIQLSDILATMSPNSGEAMNNFVINIMGNIFGDKGILTKIALDTYKDEYAKEQYLYQDSIIKQLASLVVSVDDNYLVDVVFGPEGAQYYVYSQPNFLTEFNKYRLSDPDYIKSLSNVISNNNSLFLEQIREGSILDIVTISSYRVNKKNKGYSDLDPKEAFLLNFHLLQDGFIPLPNLADKTTPFAYKGMNALKFANFKKDENGKIIIPEDIVEVFENYYKDEKNRIKQVKADIKLAQDNESYDSLVQGMHYQQMGDNGVPLDFDGNGLYYQIFTDFNTKKYSKEALISSLRNNIEDTLNKAKELGIVSATKTTEGIRYGNRGLDTSRISKYAKDNKVSTSDALYVFLAEFTLNTMMSGIETTKLFIGDPSYYKTNEQRSVIEDLFKRIGVLSSPGDKLRTDFPEGEFTRNTYNVFSIKDNIENIKIHNKDLYDNLSKAFKAAGLTDKQIEERLKGYEKINTGDAQTYITPKFFREIKNRLGEWSDDKERAYKLIMSGRPLSDSEQVIANTLMAEPLKLLYYGMHFEARHGIPTYDKMSMATLWPSMVKGTKLEYIYNRMSKDKVDMLKFESATKVGNRTRVKYLNDKDEVNKEYVDTLPSYEQDFRFLRRQQITESHESNNRLLATQVKKLVMSNLLLNEEIYNANGKNVTGSELATRLNNAYSQLSNRGFQELTNKLGITKDGNVNLEKLYDVLKESAESAHMPSQILDALTYEDGSNIINLDTFPDRKWIESRIISIVNKYTIDLMFPGDSYIQMSNFGLHKKFDDKLKLLDEKGRTEIMVSPALFKDLIPDYNKLSFEEKNDWLHSLTTDELEGLGYRIPTQGTNSIIVFVVKDFLPDVTSNTVVLPAEFTALTGSDFDIDKLFIAKYNYLIGSTGEPERHEFVEGNNFIINSEEDLEKIYQYNFREDLRLRDTLREIKGTVDIAAALGEKLTPLEQDRVIEKVSNIKELLNYFKIEDVKPYQFEKVLADLELIPDSDKWMEINKGKSAWELNSTKSIQNYTLQLMSSPLLNKAHIVENKTPLDTYTKRLKDKEGKGIVNQLRDLRGSKETFKSLEAFSPAYQSFIRQVYMGGNAAIGPFALHNVHHVLGQLYDFGLNTQYYTFAREKDGHVDLSQIKGVDGVNILDWLSALINAAVDIAKDPYIFDLNINKNTFDIVSYLLRAGVGERTFWYITQPALVEYVNTETKKKKTIKDRLTQKMYELGSVEYSYITDEKERKALILKDLDSFSNPNNIFKIAISDLKNYININTEKTYNWYVAQLGFINAFESEVKVDDRIIKKGLNVDAKLLGNAVRLSGLDRKNSGNNMAELYRYNNTLESLMNNMNLVHFRSLITNSFLGTLRKNSIGTLTNTFKGLLVTSTPTFIENLYIPLTKLLPVTNNPKLDIKNRSDLSSQIFAALVGNFFTSPTGYGYTSEDIKGLFIGKKNIGNRYNKLIEKYPELKENIFIQHIKPELNTKDNVYHIKGLTGDKKDKWQRDAISIDWEKLLGHTNEEIRKLAEDLVIVSFYTSAFSRGLFTFYHDIPIRYLDKKINERSYNDFIEDLRKDLNSDGISQEFIDKIKFAVIANNPEIFSIDEYTKDYKAYTLGKKGDPATIILTTELGDNIIKIQDKKTDKLAILLGRVDSGYIYRIIPTKGIDYLGNYIYEYGYDESVFTKEKFYTDEQIIETLLTKDSIGGSSFRMNIKQENTQADTQDDNTDSFSYSEEQQEMIKKIPTGIGAEQYDLLTKAIKSNNSEEFDEVIDLIKQCKKQWH